jgi:hypothetical protein
MRAAEAVVGTVALALFLLAAAPASAAIFDLTSDSAAEHPDIAVDESGTAHIAWNQSAGIPGDDQLVYCRVPPGAHSCDITRTIALPRTDFDGPQVVLTRSGEVVLASRRCCFPGAPVFAVASGDGGGSFGAPVEIADEFSAGSDWEATLGPGDFSLALSGGNSGPDFASIWRAAPLDGSEPGAKAKLAPFPKAYFTSTGFPAPTSPIAAYGDLNDIYLRRWGGSGDYNDQATWQPEEYVVHGNEPKLASGVRGVFLIYQGAKPPYQYFVRSYDINSPSGNAFPKRTQTVVSDPKAGQSAIFRDFFEDGAGDLHAVFRQRSRKGVWGLRHRVSVDGAKSWLPVQTLAARRAAEELYNLRVGAGEHGGAVVGDHNGSGPIWFAPFGPSGGAGGACPSTVKLGKAVALATQGCFKRHGKKFVASGPVKLNGVDIEPVGGANASVSAAFHVTAVPGQRTLATSAKASVRVGNILLEKGPVSWKVPPGNGKVVRLNSPDGSVFGDVGKFAKGLLGFPIDGDAELLIAGKGTKIPTHVRMPGLLGGVSGNTTLETNQQGQVLDGMKIDVPIAAIGLLHIGGIDVTYDGAEKFTGSAKIELPPVYSGAIGKSSVSFGFEKGELSLLKVEPPPFNPTLPIVGSPPSPIVGLDRVAFSYVSNPGSRLFQGDVFLLGGPTLGGLRAAALDGAVTLEFPQSKPTTLGATGKLSVVKIPLASGSATYTVPSSFKFGGIFKFPPPGIPGPSFGGGVDGFVDLAAKKFSASGSTSAGPLTGTVVISSKGFAGCIGVPGPLPDFGATWEWSDALPSFPICSDVGSFKVGSSSAAAASAQGVAFPAGLREADIAVQGSGAAPAVIVTAPDGAQVLSAAGTVESGRYRVTTVPAESRTYVQIGEPPAGTYQVDVQPGSAPIAEVLKAQSLPQPRVSAKVGGRGHDRVLRFRLRGIAGQHVTFAEQADRVYHEIGSTSKGRGARRFHPAHGPGGKRSIVALIEREGIPRARLTVGRYKAPPTRRLRRPRRVVARRRGARLLVRWSKVAGARGYEVRVNLPRDGRRLLFFPRRKKHGILVKGIERTDLATVKVAAIGPDLKAGRTGKAKLKPKKQRRRRRRHGRR